MSTGKTTTARGIKSKSYPPPTVWDKALLVPFPHPGTGLATFFRDIWGVNSPPRDNPLDFSKHLYLFLLPLFLLQL